LKEKEWNYDRRPAETKWTIHLSAKWKLTEQEQHSGENGHVTWHFRRSVRLIKSKLTSHPTRKMRKESISFWNNYFLLWTRWTGKKKMMITLTASGESFLEITEWRDDSLIRGHRQVNYLSNLTGNGENLSNRNEFLLPVSGIQWIELFDCSLTALSLAEPKLNRQWNATFHCSTNFLRDDDDDDWPTRQLGITVHLTLSTSSLHAKKTKMPNRSMWKYLPENMTLMITIHGDGTTFL
jgi:hypothetical protein